MVFHFAFRLSSSLIWTGMTVGSEMYPCLC
jgi:hypothetical protein